MNSATSRVHPRTLPATRWIPQLAMVLVVIGGATLRNLGFSASWIPELRALCPSGATQAIVSLFGPAVALDWSRLVIPAGVLLAAVVLGAAFCGRLCPLGSVQEWIGLLGRRVLGSRYNRPVPGDRILGLVRYAVLAGIAATALGFIAIETDLFNPSLALVHAWTSAVPITAILLLTVTLGASFFVERPWCRWLCPYGALLGTVARISPWTVRRDASTCIDCGRCDRACPLAIRVATVAAVRDDRCNRCERCIDACPVAGALALRTGTTRKGITLPAGIHDRPDSSPFKAGASRFRSEAGISAAVVLLFFTPLLLSGVADTAIARETVGGLRSFVERLDAGRSETSADHDQPESLSPENITPMMTLLDLAEKARLPVEELLEVLNLPDEIDRELMLIDIEEEPGQDHMTVGHIRSVFTEMRQ
jgi:NAD-dependent dihydropyrimidine dehydrogenase PreA subunit